MGLGKDLYDNPASSLRARKHMHTHAHLHVCAGKGMRVSELWTHKVNYCRKLFFELCACPVLLGGRVNSAT